MVAYIEWGDDPSINSSIDAQQALKLDVSLDLILATNDHIGRFVLKSKRGNLQYRFCTYSQR